MIEILSLDLCAVLLADELKVKLVLSQAEKDGLLTFCYADLPRANVRRALRHKGYLQLFDGLFYEELLLDLTSNELRLLADTSRTLWMRQPADIDYTRVLDLLGPRQRRLPRAIRLLKESTLDASVRLDEEST